MFWCCGVATIVTGIIGIVGNLLGILVLVQKSMSTVFYHLLLSLCVSDFIFLATSLVTSYVALDYKPLSRDGSRNYSFSLVTFSNYKSFFFFTSLPAEGFSL